MEFNADYIKNFQWPTYTQAQAFVGDIGTKTQYACIAVHHGFVAVSSEAFATLSKQLSEAPQTSRELAQRAWAQTDWKGIAVLTVASAIAIYVVNHFFCSSQANPPAQDFEALYLQEQAKSAALNKDLSASKQAAAKAQQDLESARQAQTPAGQAALQEQIDELTGVRQANALEIAQLKKELALAGEETKTYEAQLAERQTQLDKALAALQTLQEENATLIAAGQAFANTSSSSLGSTDTGNTSTDSLHPPSEEKEAKRVSKHVSKKLNTSLFEKAALDQDKRNSTLQGIHAAGKQTEDARKKLQELKEKEAELQRQRVQVEAQQAEFLSPRKQPRVQTATPVTRPAASSSSSSASGADGGAGAAGAAAPSSAAPGSEVNGSN